MLRQYQKKVNPAKCMFGLGSGEFLGFMVSEWGIKANLKKVGAILDMLAPQSINTIQKLIGQVAALNCFISRSPNKCLPFFKALRKAQG